MLSHVLQIVLVQVQLLGGLLVRQVQPHEIQAQHPNRQRLVMPRQDRSGQVVEAFAAGFALITLAGALRAGEAAPDRVAAVAMWAGDTFGPTQLPDGGITLGFTD